jgi:biopolymer transport protein ExbD
MSSGYFKKKAKLRRRKDEDGDPEFQVAPMVDVLLVLMLFFMSITSTEILKNDKNLHLADAEHGEQEKDVKNQLTINVTWDYNQHKPGFVFDGKTYAAPADMVDDIKKRAVANPNLYAVIRADRGVEYSYISDLMGQCAKAGLGKVSFAALSGGQREAPSEHQSQ